jgi:hypothetical protein
MHVPVPPPPRSAEPLVFRFSYHRLSRLVFALVALAWSRSSVVLRPDRIDVRFGWGFIGSFPRVEVRTAAHRTERVFECGVHGFAQRWVVNGSHRGLVRIVFAAPQPARVGVVPVRVRSLTLSLEEPDSFLAALAAPSC